MRYTGFRRFTAIAGLLAIAALTAACGDDVVDADTDALVATWDLQSVDGRSLPLSDTTLDCSYTLRSASFTFKATGTYTTLNDTVIECEGFDEEDVGGAGGGTWRAEDDQIFLLLTGETDEQVGRWSISGSTLVLTDELDGTVLVFKRR